MLEYKNGVYDTNGVLLFQQWSLLVHDTQNRLLGSVIHYNSVLIVTFNSFNTFLLIIHSS